MADIISVLELDLCSFLDAVEVAALRSSCKTVHAFVEKEPEEAFNFTLPAPCHFKFFQQEADLLWFILRRREDVHLVEHAGVEWEGIANTKGFWNQTRRHLAVLVRGFWNHPDVRALRRAAVRLDSPSLMRRLAVEAPGELLQFSDAPPSSGLFNGNTDGPSEFLHNCWIKYERALFRERDHWKPLGRDEALKHDSKIFHSKVHFMLWKTMSAVRSAQGREFFGYCNLCTPLFQLVVESSSCYWCRNYPLEFTDDSDYRFGTESHILTHAHRRAHTYTHTHIHIFINDEYKPK